MAVADYKMKWGLGGDPTDDNATLYREERVGSPEESFARGGSNSMRTLYTDWRLRDRAVRNFLGETQLSEVGDFYYPSRMVPNYHPDFFMSPFAAVGQNFQVPYMWADSLSFSGNFADTINPKSEFVDTCNAAPGAFLEAKMAVKYSSYPYFILGDDDMTLLDATLGDGAYDESTMLRYVYAKLVSSPKYQTLPKDDALSWGVDNSPMSTVAVQLMPEGDLLLKWFNVPIALYDEELVASLIGRTNNDPFGHEFAPQGVFPAGTLVLCPPDVEPFPRANGEIYLDITYRFRYYPKGANKFFRYNGAPGASNGTETLNGPGFYVASRKCRRVSGGVLVALSDTEIATTGGYVTTTSLASFNDPDATGNVLLFPFDNYSNLFRARVNKTMPIPFSGIA